MKNAELAPVKRDRASAALTRRVRARLPQLDSARSGIMLGVPEIVGLGVSMLLLVLAMVSYFYALVPARERLRVAEAGIEREQTLLRDSGRGLEQGATQQATVGEIIASLRDFEANHLPSQTEGQIAIVEELNELIRRHNLRNVGSTFTSLDAIAAGGRGASGTNSRLQSVFPGLGLTVGVEGAYTDVRRFMRDLEASRQFLVINSVELEGVRDSDAGRGANTPVSLNLNLAAYFRPAAAASVTSAPTPDGTAAATSPATR